MPFTPFEIETVDCDNTRGQYVSEVHINHETVEGLYSISAAVVSRPSSLLSKMTWRPGGAHGSTLASLSLVKSPPAVLVSGVSITVRELADDGAIGVASGVAERNEVWNETRDEFRIAEEAGEFARDTSAKPQECADKPHLGMGSLKPKLLKQRIGQASNPGLYPLTKIFLMRRTLSTAPCHSCLS